MLAFEIHAFVMGWRDFFLFPNAQFREITSSVSHTIPS